ncbi:MAG: hypothetical protein LBC03_01930 [Nitrososphaerota archaeon]|jgi:hypothetical protein|nr:hypothetical protein [Nitrososphaerota archaeon]
MKNHKNYGNKILSIFLVSAVFLLLTVVPVSFGAAINERQVKVPLVIDVSYAIAGAQFTFEYSAGLEFVSYEKSSTVFSALTTPVVMKNGYTYLGFYTVDNRYAPENGKLDVGCLVFNCLNDDSQKVTLTEIKLVQIVDNGETRSEFLVPVVIKVSSENVIKGSSVDGGNGESLIGDRDSSVDDDSASLIVAHDLLVDNSEGSGLSVGFWIALVLLFVAICVIGVLIVVKKHVNIK